MLRRPPRSTLTASPFPYPALFRSGSSDRRLSATSTPWSGGQVPRAHDPHPVDAPVGRVDVEGGLLLDDVVAVAVGHRAAVRSEEHTSEIQSLMRNSYAVFCLKKKRNRQRKDNYITKYHTYRQ